MKFTLLGSSSSFGTPAAGGYWGVCDPQEPRNLRNRASLLIESATTRLLIDASPDLRHQLNAFDVQHLDAVLLTHAHSDHINGLDDLRALTLRSKKSMDVYGNHTTMEEAEKRWPYMFDTTDAYIYAGFLTAHHLSTPSGNLRLGDIDLSFFEQDHGRIKSVGYRFGDFAYSVDASDFDEAALSALEGVRTWVVDGGGYKRDTPTAHATIKQIYEWVERLRPEMTYITVLTTHMDYQTLCAELPPHIRPAYDGLVIET